MSEILINYCGKVVPHSFCDNFGGLHSILNAISCHKGQGIPHEDVYVTCNGHIVEPSDVLQAGQIYHVVPRLVGGKGGFGSMLRAIGAQIEKTTSREACRDLSGRRMRDVNNEKKLKDWMGKQGERAQEKEQRRQERLERRKAVPNHKFDDPKYDQQKAQVAENLEDAVMQGLTKKGKSHSKASSSATLTSEARKRKLPDESPVDKKKAAAWLGMDIDNLSDLDSDSSGEDSDGMTGASSENTSDEPSTSRANVGPPHSTSESSKDTMSSTEDSNPTSSGNSVGDRLESKSESEPASESCSSDCSEIGKVKIERKCEQDSNSRFLEGIKSESASLLDNGLVTGVQKIKCEKDLEDSDSSACRLEAVSDISIKSESESCGSGLQVGVTVKVENEVKVKQEETKHEEEKPKHGLLAALSGSPPKNERVQVNERNDEVSASIDLDDFDSAKELEELGLDRLKLALTERGLKCGGTLQERAERLFSVKGLARDQINPALFAKPAKGKHSKNKK